MIRLLSFSLLILLAAHPLAASEPVLTVTGAITNDKIKLTHDNLLELPQKQLITATTVTDGRSTFEGFLIRDLLEAHELNGEVVVARALNDYQIEIPISDFERFDVIGALSMDGVALSPRDKGPIWIVYPRDDHAELQDIRYDTRWVWQLISLHVQ
ncbi:molybdopterin-dependent oxidoreductase [Roseinatronobacter alkalisoli]|uniref:Molybdopterin-dependent oxidoreductase n=1 Tax=Roseinatronobacter alkalisoli TaxID=3028235 RepID=A0ABT5TG64_9RHOB|nr:molybdopterin-dependent oxidoreductase [Roseinatronobacter sp. HJB301]MDD7974016.1 molybdopterin-dependent oxidoreductase [Roseinatronobacter sp. HJB301]